MPEGSEGFAPQEDNISISTPEVVQVPDAVLEKFKSGNVLVRVMDPPRPSVGLNGVELEMNSWREELEFMSAEAGMNHVSTTLLMEGKAIAMYHKPFGFIFDAEKVKSVEHVAAVDSGSGTSSSGELVANATDLHTLQELRDYYGDSQGTQEMNEVNVTVGKEAILGLVLRKGITSPSVLASIEVVRKYLKNTGTDIPVYEYDERLGKMQKYVEADKDKLLAGIRPEFRAAYASAM